MLPSKYLRQIPARRPTPPSRGPLSGRTCAPPELKTETHGRCSGARRQAWIKPAQSGPSHAAADAIRGGMSRIRCEEWVLRLRQYGDGLVLVAARHSRLIRRCLRRPTWPNGSRRHAAGGPSANVDKIKMAECTRFDIKVQPKILCLFLPVLGYRIGNYRVPFIIGQPRIAGCAAGPSPHCKPRLR
jgi:hypothetical protein